jgi:hypothetical protein
MNDTVGVISLSVVSATLAPVRRCAYLEARFRDDPKAACSRTAVEDEVAR